MTDKNFIQTRTELTKSLVGTLDYDEAIKLAKRVWSLRDTNNKIIFAGNGASNTIANHAALDYMSQIAVQTISINDPAIITAFSNDFGYDGALERYCKINFKKGDLFVAVSSSGNSPNVVNAAKYVKSVGGHITALTGFDKDNKLKNVADSVLWVDSTYYNVVESIHNIWLAMVCDLLTEWMGNKAGLHGIELD